MKDAFDVVVKIADYDFEGNNYKNVIPIRTCGN